MRRTRTFTVAVAVLAFASAAAGCSSDGSEATERGVIRASGDVLFPFRSLEEKRTFSDAWVAGTVTSELIEEIDEGDEGAADTARGREVTIQLDETLWQRPDIAIPAEITEAGPVIVNGDRVDYLVIDGGVPLEVDQRYLLGLLEQSDGRLVIAAPSAVLNLEGDQVVVPADDPNEDPSRVDVQTYVDRIASATPVVADDVGDAEARLEAWPADDGDEVAD